MEQRIGTLLILIRDKSSVAKFNQIVSKHAKIVIGRQGIPLREKQVNIISLVLEGTTDQIGALSGQIGRLPKIQVKSVLLKNDIEY